MGNICGPLPELAECQLPAICRDCKRIRFPVAHSRTNCCACELMGSGGRSTSGVSLCISPPSVLMKSIKIDARSLDHSCAEESVRNCCFDLQTTNFSIATMLSRFSPIISSSSRLRKLKIVFKKSVRG